MTKNVLAKIDPKMTNIVKAGPFAGMKLSNEGWWGGSDKAARLLGSYEDSIQEKIYLLSEEITAANFVDIGAADGYFAIGVSRFPSIEKVFAFEVSEIGRNSLQHNALINDIHNIIIDGLADVEKISIIEDQNERLIYLIDIEGAEYELLSKDFLSVVRNSHLIVELHPFLVANGDSKQSSLLNRCEDYFHINFIDHFPKPRPTDDMLGLNEDEVLLAYSEGRAVPMQWLFLTPRSD
jgi:hypothetical protein